MAAIHLPQPSVDLEWAYGVQGEFPSTYIMLFIHVVSSISKHKYPLPLHFPLIRCLNQWFNISVTHRPPPQHVKG